MQGAMQQEQGQGEVILFGVQLMAREQSERAFPWYSDRTRKLADPLLRMHNEAIDFYLYLSPIAGREQHDAQLLFYQKIKRIVQGEFPEATVLSPFLLNKLYLRGSETEMYVLMEGLNGEKAGQLGACLAKQVGNLSVPPCSEERYEIYEWEVEVGGRKAVVRVLEAGEWLDFFDLIQQNIQGIVELKYVYLIFSCMIRQRWLHLGIRPYLLLALLSVFYHERRKHKHRTLSENIIKFVEYYGVGPFQERRVSYLGKGRYELVQEGQLPTPFSFWITERTNIASPLLREFFGVLKNRYRLISNYNFDEEQSIIGSLVNPCQKEFQYL